MAAGQWVIDVGEHDFEARVVDRSHEVPVVVDFWAPWCGPCRTLGPLLEAAVKRRSGAVVLAKVNVDDNQRLATAFQVEGIPFVVAFRGGKPVLSFTGLLGEPDLEAFLDRLAPSAADKAVADARALEAGSPAAAEKAYRDQLTKVAGPCGGDGGAGAGAARPGAGRRGRRPARGDRAGLGGACRGGAVAGAQGAANAGGGASPGSRVATSDRHGSGSRQGPSISSGSRWPPRTAIQRRDALLAAAERDKAMARGPVREAMLKVFQVVGMRSDLADDYRARLQRLLY